MFCPKCGNNLSENDRFCQKCGTPVMIQAAAPAPAVQEAAPAVQEAAPAVQEVAPAVQEAAPVYTAPVAPAPEVQPQAAPVNPYLQQAQAAAPAQPQQAAPAPEVQPQAAPVNPYLQQAQAAAPAQPQSNPYVAPQQVNPYAAQQQAQNPYTAQPQANPYVAPQYQQPYAPQRPAGPSLGTNLLNTLKSMVNPAKATIAAADKTGIEGLIFIGAYILVYALSIGVNLVQSVSSIVNMVVKIALKSMFSYGLGSMGSYAKSIVRSYLKPVYGTLFGHAFGATILFTLFTVAILVLCVFVASRIAKKPAQFTQALNVVGTATLIPTAVAVLNLLVGFIPVPFARILDVIALIAMYIALFAGIKKLYGKKDSTVYYIFLGIMAITLIFTIIFMLIFFIATIANVGKTVTSAFQSLDFDDLLSGAGSLGDLLGY